MYSSGGFKNARWWRAIYFVRKKKQEILWGFHLSHLLGSARRKVVPFSRASSAKLKPPGAATLLGRDPDMRRNVPTAPLLASQPKVSKCENEPSATGARHAKKVHIIHTRSIHIYICKLCLCFPLEIRSFYPSTSSTHQVSVQILLH